LTQDVGKQDLVEHGHLEVVTAEEYDRRIKLLEKVDVGYDCG
jgi:hypothetical protein